MKNLIFHVYRIIRFKLRKLFSWLPLYDKSPDLKIKFISIYYATLFR